MPFPNIKRCIGRLTPILSEGPRVIRLHDFGLLDSAIVMDGSALQLLHTCGSHTQTDRQKPFDPGGFTLCTILPRLRLSLQIGHPLGLF